MGFIDRIKSLVSDTHQSTSNQKETVSLGQLSSENIEQIFQETNIKLSPDFQRIIDNYAVKHTFRKHGNEKQEASRGQIAVKAEDFEKILEIIGNPDKIKDGGTNGIGRQVIFYQKDIGNIYFYVEEVRPKKKALAMQTLFIRKKTKNRP